MKKIVLILLILVMNNIVDAKLTEEQMNILNSDPAIIALMNNNIEKVRELVNNGDHASFMLWRSVLISEDILFGNIEIAEMLLKEFNADPNFRYTKNQEVPLMNVVSTAMLNLLIQHGADINAQNINGETPLMLNIRAWPNREMVYAMIKAGANVHIKNNEGKSALDYAIKRQKSLNTSIEEGQYHDRRYDNIIKLLQKAGAK